MPSRRLPVACVQTHAHDREQFAESFGKILDLIDEAGRRGARLIVVPEGTVPAYVLGDEPVDPELLAHAQQSIATIAGRHEAVIVYGSAHTVAGVTSNVAVTLGPDGTLLGYPAKHFLWHFDRRWFTAGTRIEPVESPLGRLGILVCADGRIPTIARTLVERGAEILVMPTAWVTSGRNPDDLENIQADLFVNVRARENGVPFIAANKAGVERASVAYCGKSTIVGADGATIARASSTDQTIIYAEVELDSANDGTSSERLTANALYLDPVIPPPAAIAPERARVAFTAATDPQRLAALAHEARVADAVYLIAPAMPARVPGGLTVLVAAGDGAETGEIVETGTLRAQIVSYERLCDPAALVPARLAGIDLVVCTAYDEHDAFALAFVRTRAIELRTFVVALDGRGARALACDPDGVIVAGTFGALDVAAFLYDRSRSGATMVAPGTDVLAGLRAADSEYRAALVERHAQLDRTN